MKINLKWLKFWARKPRKLEEILQDLKPSFANKYNEMEFYDKLTVGAVSMKNGQYTGISHPQLIYGWLDPDCGIEENKAWLLYALKGHFFEFRMVFRSEDDKPDIQANGTAFTLEELRERLKCGDYNEMINLETDKTVNEELESIFNK